LATAYAVNGESEEVSRPRVSTRVDTKPAVPDASRKRGIKRRMTRSELEPWDGNPRLERSEQDLYDKGASLSEHGQIADLIVRPHPDPEKWALGIHQVVAGVTRFLGGAAPYGDFAIYNVEVRELTDLEAIDVAYLENDKSNPMRPLDHAFYFRKRMKMENAGEDSLRLLAAKLKIGPERVRQHVNLLTLPGLRDDDTIEPGSILDRFRKLGLNEKQGRALLMLRDYPDEQLSLLAQIERGAVSGTAAITKAKKMIDAAKKDDEEESKAGAGATPGAGETPVAPTPNEGASGGATPLETTLILAGTPNAGTPLEQPGAEPTGTGNSENGGTGGASTPTAGDAPSSNAPSASSPSAGVQSSSGGQNFGGGAAFDPPKPNFPSHAAAVLSTVSSELLTVKDQLNAVDVSSVSARMEIETAMLDVLMDQNEKIGERLRTLREQAVSNTQKNSQKQQTKTKKGGGK
jgi:ParB/RepB/Spo0J family partition protein